jgi:hypothetical protein
VTMHSISWPTLGASALAAILTTLIVEYFAKPRLEARKERILEKYREMRAGVKDTRLSISLTTRLLGFMDKNSVGQISEDYISKIKAELADRVTNAYRVLQPPRSLLTEWARVTLVVEAFALTFKMDLPWEDMDPVPTLQTLQLFHDYFGTPKWHIWHRHGLVREIESMQVPIEEWLASMQEANKASEENNSLPD